jgi:hypothetical protein
VIEAEWLAATDPKPMLQFLRGKASDRKLRLFAAACARQVWHLMDDLRPQAAVEVAERYAEGGATAKELATAGEAAYEPVMPMVEDIGLLPDAPNAAAIAAAQAACFKRAARAARNAARQAAAGTTAKVRQARAALFRDVFANPFRPAPSVEPAWLVWNGGIVRKLADTAYEERRLPSGTLEPARLAVLTDALEDAGCADAELLGHLRGPGPHVRGCWAVDLLLGKG